MSLSGLRPHDVSPYSFDALCALLDCLGLDVSIKKLVYPSTSAVCLGINIDTVDGSISIPREKLCQILRHGRSLGFKTILLEASTSVITGISSLYP